MKDPANDRKLRCPATVQHADRGRLRCMRTYHPNDARHVNGSCTWDASEFSEEEARTLAQDNAALEKAKDDETSARFARHALRLETEEACLRAAKRIAESADCVDNAIGAKALVEAACLLRGI